MEESSTLLIEEIRMFSGLSSLGLFAQQLLEENDIRTDDEGSQKEPRNGEYVCTLVSEFVCKRNKPATLSLFQMCREKSH